MLRSDTYQLLDRQGWPSTCCYICHKLRVGRCGRCNFPLSSAEMLLRSRPRKHMEMWWHTVTVKEAILLPDAYGSCSAYRPEANWILCQHEPFFFADDSDDSKTLEFRLQRNNVYIKSMKNYNAYTRWCTLQCLERVWWASNDVSPALWYESSINMSE